jgi:hypothetical protein
MATMGESGVSLVMAIRRHILLPAHRLAEMCETATKGKNDGFLLWSSTVSVGKTRANPVCSQIAALYLEIASLCPQNKNIFVGIFSSLLQLCIDCLQGLATT